MRFILLAGMTFALASIGTAHAQTGTPAPGGAAAQPSITTMSGDAAERWLNRQSDYRRLDDGVEENGRALRARPARAKDVMLGLDVRDSAGLVVGTVSKVDKGVAVVAGEGGSVEVDIASLAKNKQGLLINLPKAKIDAMMVRNRPAN